MAVGYYYPTATHDISLGINVYYRGSDNKLHKHSVKQAIDCRDAIQAVLEHLNETGEKFFKPVLCVVNGGKV